MFTPSLNHTFSLKDLGDVHYFLGLEISRDDTGIFICQKKYVLDLLVRFDMEKCSSCPTPMVVGQQFASEEAEPLKIPTIFRRLIEALQYIINTRLDINFSVNKLNRFLNCPNLKHWQAAKRILRYLKGTSKYGLHLRPSNHLNLSSYCDANRGVSHEDKKSISGYSVYLGNSLVS